MNEINSQQIIKVLKEVLNEQPKVRRSETLIKTVYSVLVDIYISKKTHIVIDAPTGSGKTIIAYLLSMCMNRLEYGRYKNIAIDDIDEDSDDIPFSSYILTSSKVLQDQIEADKAVFNFETDTLEILKGVNNYPCIFDEVERKLSKKGGFEIPQSEKEVEKITYAERKCKGMDKKAIQGLSCYKECPYLLQREGLLNAKIGVLNYYYYLTAINSPFSKVGKRVLTICDEAHLLPDIVTQLFNVDLGTFRYLTDRMLGVIIKIENAIAKKVFSEVKNALMESRKLFNRSEITLSDAKIYIEKLKLVCQAFMDFYKLMMDDLNTNNKTQSLIYIKTVLKKDLNNIIEDVTEFLENEFIDQYFNNLLERPNDLLIMSKPRENHVGEYDHYIKDLDETRTIKRYFYGKEQQEQERVYIYMSATIVNIDHYATMLGLDPNQYSGYRLPSTFDFSASPIYLCNAGSLNYNNFKNNIDDIIQKTLKICLERHPDQCGIIHTTTFNIADKLKTEVLYGNYSKEFKNRFLFYKTAQEKSQCLELMKENLKEGIYSIICGASLYEGIDLKDDLGRFNILIKVPYASLDTYIKMKIQRYPQWYENVTLEKIIQAIGRTNRNAQDYSATYLLDSLFNRIIYTAPEYVCKRVKSLKI